MSVKLQKLIIIAVILLSLLPAAYINNWLLKSIQPRKSFGAFMLYLFTSLALIFVYTFLLIIIIIKLFPQAKG